MQDKHFTPGGSTAFRLAHELEGILAGIRADGVISQQETARVQRWLAENERYASIRPFEEIAQRLDRVLADGVITIDECDDLLFVVQKLTTVNPYFDSLRAGIQILMGLLAGVSADGALRTGEVVALSQWLEEWGHLQGLWPYDECYTIVTSIVTSGSIDDRKDYLFALSRQFPVAGEVDEKTGEVPPLLLTAVCAVDPVISFPNSRFVFTGESRKGERTLLEGLVAERGGVPWPRVTAEANYLVVCEEGSPYWAFACYGRKVEQAYNLRRKGHSVVIVHERDFWDAIASTGV